MTFFALFNILSFMAGIFLWKRQPKLRLVVAALTTVFVAIGYYYLGRI